MVWEGGSIGQQGDYETLLQVSPLAEVVNEMVGLRPGRYCVRLEIDETLTKHSAVIHNYGHAGQGITFSRNCKTGKQLFTKERI